MCMCLLAGERLQLIWEGFCQRYRCRRGVSKSILIILSLHYILVVMFKCMYYFPCRYTCISCSINFYKALAKTNKLKLLLCLIGNRPIAFHYQIGQSKPVNRKSDRRLLDENRVNDGGIEGKLTNDTKEMIHENVEIFMVH